MASVLLVEDDSSIQTMYATALKQGGFEVATASNGGEALQALQNPLGSDEAPHFDVILLDMMMSGMSGLDVLRNYDIRVQSPSTIVIALTNMDNPAIEQKAKDLGVAEYLTKAETDPVQLIAHIKELLAKQAQVPAQPQSPAN